MYFSLFMIVVVHGKEVYSAKVYFLPKTEEGNLLVNHNRIAMEELTSSPGKHFIPSIKYHSENASIHYTLVT